MSSKGNGWRVMLAAIGLAIGFSSVTAAAQTRFVVVNGQRLTDQQIQMLEYFHCAYIPNGGYWLNINNGAWGYVGNWNVQGYFGQPCYAAGNHQARQRRQSLSERGLLYSPGEILSGR